MNPDSQTRSRTSLHARSWITRPSRRPARLLAGRRARLVSRWPARFLPWALAGPIANIRVSSLAWLGRVLAAAALAAVATVLIAGPGQAHSQEVASDPADKSKVAVVPAAVTLTFNENVLGLGTRVEVTGPGGDVTDGATTVTDNIVRQAISPTAPAGKYTVQWRVTSGDGHPVSGEFTFSAAEAAGTPPASTSAAPGNAAITTPSPSAVTPAITAASATTNNADDAGGGLSGLTVIGIAAVVLAVLIALTAAIHAVIRSRRPS